MKEVWNNKQKRKKAAIVLVFILVAAGLMVYLLNVFVLDDQKALSGFYHQEENSLDGIYIGSSAVYRYWIPTQAYDEYGMKIYDIGTGSEPVVLQKYLIKEALKTQPNMKVVLLDIRSLLKSGDELKEADISRVTDAMKMSSNRTEAIDAALDYFKKEGAPISYNKSYYYYPFLLYHSRWSDDFSPSDLKPFRSKSPYMGFEVSDMSTAVYKNTKPSYTEDQTKLSEAKIEILEDLLAYCKTLDQKVIFVSALYSISQDDQKELNASISLIRKSGFTVLDFNSKAMEGKIGLNWSTDFMDSNHVNYLGAVKYTSYLSSYLNKNVKFSSDASDSVKETWDKAALKLKESIVKRFADAGLSLKHDGETVIP